MTAKQLVSLLDYKEPIDYWSSLNGLLNCSAQIPSMLQLSQMSLVNSLQFYVDNNGQTEDQDTNEQDANEQDTKTSEDSKDSEDSDSPKE